MLTLTEFAYLAQQAATDGQVTDCQADKAALLADHLEPGCIEKVVALLC